MSDNQAATGQELNAILEDAARNKVRVSIGVQYQNRWLPIRACLLASRQDGLVLKLAGQAPPKDALDGQTCTLTFKLRSYRYVAESALRGPVDVRLEDGKPAEGFLAKTPQQLARFDRRAHQRLDVPGGAMVRAEFSPGQLTEPRWSGQVLNLSPGGLQLRTSEEALEYFEPGDLLSLSVSFATDAQPLRVSAHFRGGMRDGHMALLGLEFAPTGTPEEFALFLRQVGEQLRKLQ